MQTKNFAMHFYVFTNQIVHKQSVCGLKYHCTLFFICVAGDDEEEMEHQDEGKEELSEPEGTAEDSQGGDPSETTQKKVKGQPCLRRLFTFSLVNSYGTADINSLATDGKLLKLNCKHIPDLSLWGLWICLQILAFNTPCCHILLVAAEADTCVTCH